MTKTSSIDNFVVWPLQKVDPRLYKVNNIICNKAFRRYASGIEQHWIKVLKSLKPRGLNTCNAKKEMERKTRRKQRLRRWESRRSSGQRRIEDDESILTTDTRNWTRVKRTRTTNNQQQMDNKVARGKVDRLLIKLQGENNITKYIETLSEYNKIRTRNYCMKITEKEGFNNHIDQIITALNKSMKYQKPEIDFSDFIKLVQSHPTLRNIKIGKIINNRRYKHLLPKSIDHINICIKSLKPFKTYLCNHSQVAKEVFEGEYDEIDGNQCQCKKFFSKFQWDSNKHLVDGHVCTTDLSMMEDGTVKDLFAYGTKYRITITEETLLTAFKLAVEGFIHKVREQERKLHHTIFEEDLQQWITEMEKEFKRQYDQHETKLPTFSMCQQDKKDLNKLKEVFVISPCDKLSHNYGITCKHLYLKKLKEELLGNSTYEKMEIQSQDTAGQQEEIQEGKCFTECIEIHKQFNTKHNLEHTNNLPYLYAVPKMHKKKMRFIAGVGKSILEGILSREREEKQRNNSQSTSGESITDNERDSTAYQSSEEDEEDQQLQNRSPQYRRHVQEVAQRYSAKPHKPKCSTTAASKFLSKQLNLIIDILRHKDDNICNTEGYKRCFITRKAEEVFAMIKDNQHTFNQMTPKTFDFTTLYTKLPHQEILQNMALAIMEAMEYKEDQRRKGANGFLAKFGELESYEKLMEFVEFIVCNTYIANDVNHVYKQTVGIPMGTNCAPEIATLVLYVWEARYIDSLVDNNQSEEAKKHKYTRRFIDDIVCFNVDPIPREAYNDLEYSEQTNPDGSVTFLGATFRQSNGRFCIEVFDKSQEWKFKVLKYPSARSNTPGHQSKGIFMGEVRRYQLMVNSLSAFKKATTNLTRNMYIRGYRFGDIRNAWIQFMDKYGKSFSNKKQKDLRRWFVKMIYWAFLPNPRKTSVHHQPRNQHHRATSAVVDIHREEQQRGVHDRSNQVSTIQNVLNNYNAVVVVVKNNTSNVNNANVNIQQQQAQRRVQQHPTTIREPTGITDTETALIEEEWEAGGFYNIEEYEWDNIYSTSSTSTEQQDEIPVGFFEEHRFNNLSTTTQQQQQQIQQQQVQQHNNNFQHINNINNGTPVLLRTETNHELTGPTQEEETEESEDDEQGPAVVDQIDNRIVIRNDRLSMTVQEARNEVLTYYHAATDRTKMRLFILDETLSPSPRIDDPTNIWTEELVDNHRKFLNNCYDKRFEGNVRLVTNKIGRYNKQGQPIENASRYRFFCVICWQRYKRQEHRVKVCKDGLRLRKLALHHQIHGTLLPLPELD